MIRHHGLALARRVVKADGVIHARTLAHLGLLWRADIQPPVQESSGVSAWTVILIVLAVAVVLAIAGYVIRQRRRT